MAEEQVQTADVQQPSETEETTIINQDQIPSETEETIIINQDQIPSETDQEKAPEVAIIDGKEASDVIDESTEEGETSEDDAEATDDPAAPEVKEGAPASKPSRRNNKKEEKKVELKVTTSTPPSPPTPEVKAPKVKEHHPHHVAFFFQFLEMVKLKRSEAAIKALNNSIKSALKVNTGEAFNQVFTIFKENKDALPATVVLQAVSTIPTSERAVLEIVTTIFQVLANNNQKAQINLETVRQVVKNEAFVNWCIKKFDK